MLVANGIIIGAVLSCQLSGQGTPERKMLNSEGLNC